MLTRPAQSKILYTIDPRALHNIYVKEQDVYEESEILLTYVHASRAIVPPFTHSTLHRNFGLYLGPGLLATLGGRRTEC